MEIIKKFDNLLTKAEEYVVALLLSVMMMSIFLAVVERFVFQFGFTWVEEFARYLSVWGAFIGSGLAVKKGAHIGIEAFVQILPAKIREIEDLAVDIVGFGFSMIVFWIGSGFLFKLVETGQESPAMGISIAWAYAAVPFGCGLMAIHYLIKFIVGAYSIKVGKSNSEAA